MIKPAERVHVLETSRSEGEDQDDDQELVSSLGSRNGVNDIEEEDEDEDDEEEEEGEGDTCCNGCEVTTREFETTTDSFHVGISTDNEDNTNTGGNRREERTERIGDADDVLTDGSRDTTVIILDYTHHGHDRQGREGDDEVDCGTCQQQLQPQPQQQQQQQQQQHIETQPQQLQQGRRYRLLDRTKFACHRTGRTQRCEANDNDNGNERKQKQQQQQQQQTPADATTTTGAAVIVPAVASASSSTPLMSSLTSPANDLSNESSSWTSCSKAESNAACAAVLSQAGAAMSQSRTPNCNFRARAYKVVVVVLVEVLAGVVVVLKAITNVFNFLFPYLLISIPYFLYVSGFGLSYCSSSLPSHFSITTQRQSPRRR